jgi:DNA-binding SARP family transcriptional activator
MSGGQTPDAARARAATAARLLGAASALRERRGAEVVGPDLARYEATVASARAALGAEFAGHWEAGASLDLDGAFRLAAEAEVVDDATAPVDAPVPVSDVLPAAPPSASPVARAPQPEPDAGAGVDVEVRAFGPLQVMRDGVQVPSTELTPAKVRELLLYLVLHPAGRTKEQIALALWPDASPAQLRNAIHVTMHQLRRALGGRGAVTFDGGAHRIGAPGVRAVAERGPLGEGEAAGEWLAGHAARVGAAWAEAMEALARLAVRAEAPGEAVAPLEALVAAEPLREGAHRMLMAAYVTGGEPARALAHYDALVARLAREVGAAPGRETQALAATIRGGAGRTL